MPADVTLELRFDRYILPSRAVRQSVRLFTNDPEQTVFLEPNYDAVERVVQYRLQEGEELEQGLLYTLELLVPKDDSDDGFRAFDGAPLEEGPVSRLVQFRTAPRAPDETFSARVPPDPMPTCADALTILISAGCAKSDCHSSEQGRMGLDLLSEQGLRATAIGKVAHETAVGPQGSATLENSPRLGVQMPLIDPGQPGNSYLLYKLLRNPQNFSSAAGAPECVSQHRVALPEGQCPAPSDPERERLREWFVRGEPMPMGTPSAPYRRLTLPDLRALQRWIAGGAPCR